jgi:hypothetical protein
MATPLLMTSYRSELAVLAVGLAVIGTLAQSGLINIRLVRCVCDNKSAIISSNRQRTDIIFHKRETDVDAISTIQELQEIWYNNLDINYSLVKGHADKLDREPDKYEGLNILADEIWDDVRVAATGIMRARGSCGMWLSETCAFFFRG